MRNKVIVDLNNIDEVLRQQRDNMTKRCVNKVILIGNVGSDARAFEKNKGCSIRIATNDEFFDKQTQDKKTHTEWHNILFFGKLAEIVLSYVSKGSYIYIEGRLTTKKYQDADGNDKYYTSIVAHEMIMLDNKPSSASKPYKDDKAHINNDNMYDDIPF